MKLREVKNKINATQNIHDLTQALELIATMKARKFKDLTLSSRPFAQKSIEILTKLLQYKREEEIDKRTELNEQTKVKNSKKFLVIVFASDKGFCGVYNKNILKYAEAEIEKLKNKAEIELITIGKKATKFFRDKNYKIRNEFLGEKKFEEKEITDELFNSLLEFYQKGEYQKIILLATHFTSFVQTPRIIQIFPLDEENLKMIVKDIVGEKAISEKRIDYIFEPSFEEVYKEAIFQLMSAELYYAILEAKTSEETSRMMAMKRATDNAEDIIKDLTLEYNKARQVQITSEISEITSAKEAVQ